jgi:CheY-like chemotaxis protein
MRLQCLVVTRERATLELLRPALESSGIDVEVRAEADSASEICRRRHLDGFVVDCDDVPGGRNLMACIRSSGSNRMSTILAVVNGGTSINDALEQGANFVLGKPLSPERLQAYLKIARVFMESEHRRYFRFAVNLPVRVCFDDEHVVEARMVNISEGGMALRLPGSKGLQGTARLEFDLPSIEPFKVQAKGEVIWGDGGGLAGVRFLYMGDESRRNLLDWLSQLHGQMELQELSEPKAN